MSFLKKVIIKFLGRKRIEFIRSKPFLVHGKYRNIVKDLEKYSLHIDMEYGKDPSLSLLLVRKFGHILDKGLHRDDVEKGHSQIIAEELSKHIKIAEKRFENDETLIWAKNKLKIYYDLQKNGTISIPEEKLVSNSISFNDLEDLIKNRRSNRTFFSKQVDEQIIAQLATTVNWAPSSCNKQPIMLFATTNPVLAKACLKCCKGGTGFSEFIPAFISFTADMRGYYLPDEAYLPDIDVALGVQNFLIAAETFGLSATILSWALKETNEEQRLRQLLSISENSQIILNVVLGYPRKRALTPVRKNLSETLFIKN